MFNALIRTYHITSRKKVAKIKAAGKKLGCYALLRSGGSPGMMYVEGSEMGVRGWVDVVHEISLLLTSSGVPQKLRYKDYQLISPPAPIVISDMNQVNSQTSLGRGNADRSADEGTTAGEGGFEEVEQVREFGKRMEDKGLLAWWRKKVGYSAEE